MRGGRRQDTEAEGLQEEFTGDYREEEEERGEERGTCTTKVEEGEEL